LTESEGGTVISVEYWVANSSLCIHVAMVNRSYETNFGCLEGIISGELNI
jgi:hypothetical protein